MKQPIAVGSWHLTLDGKPVLAGTPYADFRGDTAIIIGGTPPHKSSSNGFVHTAAGAEYYAGVFDMKWVQKDPDLTPPPGYTADELERDNPFNQWMYEQ